MIAEDTVLCDDFERMGGVRLRFSALWCRYRTSISAFLAIGLLYLFLAAAGIGCPLKFFSGISCPGCGMTRAFLHALRFEFAEAFYYHPLWVAVVPVLALLLLLRIRHKGRALYAVLFAAAALMLFVYVWRLFFVDGSVVVCAPEEGFFYRSVQALCRFFDLK